MFGRMCLYALTNLECPDFYLTVVTKKEDAVEYAKRILILEHKDHFISWCKYRNLDIKDIQAINMYCEDCISLKEKESFKIIKFKPTKENIACTLRMFSGSIPLGCAYDTSVEYKYFADKLNQNNFSEDIVELLKQAAELNPSIKIEH